MNTLKDNRDLLYRLYVEENLSLSDIAKEYSVSSMTVRAWLKRVGIKTRGSTVSIYKELKNTDFSDAQKQLLIGSILGDGSFTKGKACKNARFVERHCEEQLNYLQWKNDKLKPFVKSKLSKSKGGDHIISGVKCTTQDSYILSTITHPYITELYNKFYKNGKKVVPLDLFDNITALALAIWFCDEGCFTYNKKNSIYRLDIHTECFTYKENVFLCREILSKFFNLSFRVNTRTYKSGKAYYICLSGENKLKNVVTTLRPFIPGCMLYKFKAYL